MILLGFPSKKHQVVDFALKTKGFLWIRKIQQLSKLSSLSLSMISTSCWMMGRMGMWWSILPPGTDRNAEPNMINRNSRPSRKSRTRSTRSRTSETVSTHPTKARMKNWRHQERAYVPSKNAETPASSGRSPTLELWLAVAGWSPNFLGDYSRLYCY